MEDLAELEEYSNDATVHKNVVVLDSFEKPAGDNPRLQQSTTQYNPDIIIIINTLMCNNNDRST